ncbi:MAG: hypothetical protein H0X29_05245 [Parachlamydiaceae bacterium]|nr:hypothetical protein [Parachlamydiaceae bacterium]
MKIKSIFTTLVYSLSFCSSNFTQALDLPPNEEYLSNRLLKIDRRYSSFLLVLDLLKHRQAKVLVETGTARDGDKNFSGDGGSTIIFGDWASQNNALLFTVDISSQAIENARISTIKFTDSIIFCCSDSISFLKDFNQSIDFLYLDSFDYDFNNPLPSQQHHLYEIMAAYPKLHADSIVMVDDCDLPHGGKGKFIIEFLLEKGWTIIYEGYQTILVKNIL